MAGIETGTFNAPTSTVEMEGKGRVDALELGGGRVLQVRLEPGWSWSEHQQPIVGTDRCEHRHLGICTSGRLHVVTRDGEERELAAGDVFHIEPGHESWVVGREAFTALEIDVPRERLVAPAPSPHAAPPVH